LDGIQRGGVVSIDWGKSLSGVSDQWYERRVYTNYFASSNSQRFKELYVFPLSSTSAVPTFMQRKYSRNFEDILVGVFLTDKTQPPIFAKNVVTQKETEVISPIPKEDTFEG
jgi:hypothetical protein